MMVMETKRTKTRMLGKSPVNGKCEKVQRAMVVVMTVVGVMTPTMETAAVAKEKAKKKIQD